MHGIMFNHIVHKGTLSSAFMSCTVQTISIYFGHHIHVETVGFVFGTTGICIIQLVRKNMFTLKTRWDMMTEDNC